MDMYKPKDFDKIINVSIKTLQQWDNENTLKACRNSKLRKYINEDKRC